MPCRGQCCRRSFGVPLNTCAWFVVRCCHVCDHHFTVRFPVPICNNAHPRFLVFTINPDHPRGRVEGAEERGTAFPSFLPFTVSSTLFSNTTTRPTGVLAQRYVGAGIPDAVSVHAHVQGACNIYLSSSGLCAHSN